MKTFQIFISAICMIFAEEVKFVPANCPTATPCIQVSPLCPEKSAVFTGENTLHQAQDICHKSCHPDIRGNPTLPQEAFFIDWKVDALRLDKYSSWSQFLT